MSTATIESGFFRGERGLLGRMLLLTEAFSQREPPVHIRRDVDDPRTMLLARDVLPFQRHAAAPYRVVIGAENPAMIRHKHQRIVLAAYGATGVRRKHGRPSSSLGIEPLSHGELATAYRIRHATFPGVSPRFL